MGGFAWREQAVDTRGIDPGKVSTGLPMPNRRRNRQYLQYGLSSMIKSEQELYRLYHTFILLDLGVHRMRSALREHVSAAAEGRQVVERSQTCGLANLRSSEGNNLSGPAPTEVEMVPAPGGGWQAGEITIRRGKLFEMSGRYPRLASQCTSGDKVTDSR